MNLRELRKERGLKTVELAELVGVSDSTINRWENGVHKIKPKYKKILKELFEQPITTPYITVSKQKRINKQDNLVLLRNLLLAGIPKEYHDLIKLVFKVIKETL